MAIRIGSCATLLDGGPAAQSHRKLWKSWLLVTIVVGPDVMQVSLQSLESRHRNRQAYTKLYTAVMSGNPAYTAAEGYATLQQPHAFVPSGHADAAKVLYPDRTGVYEKNLQQSTSACIQDFALLLQH